MSVTLINLGPIHRHPKIIPSAPLLVMSPQIGAQIPYFEPGCKSSRQIVVTLPQAPPRTDPSLGHHGYPTRNTVAPTNTTFTTNLASTTTSTTNNTIMSDTSSATPTTILLLLQPKMHVNLEPVRTAFKLPCRSLSSGVLHDKCEFGHCSLGRLVPCRQGERTRMHCDEITSYSLSFIISYGFSVPQPYTALTARRKGSLNFAQILTTLWFVKNS